MPPCWQASQVLRISPGRRACSAEPAVSRLRDAAPVGRLHVQLQQLTARVDGDGVAFIYQRDRPADEGLRCDVPDNHAPGAP